MSRIYIKQDPQNSVTYLRNDLDKKEQVNVEMLNYIENAKITSVLPVIYNNQKKNRFLQAELSRMYSIDVRLASPVASTEALLIIKEIYDSLGKITMHNISLNFVTLSLDRAFITQDGTIKWLIWGTEPANDYTVLDLYYEVSNKLMAREARDEDLINEFKNIFAQSYNGMDEYLRDIEHFLSKRYADLEKHLLKKFEDKQAEIEPSPKEALKEVENLKGKLQRKDRDIKRLKVNVADLEDEIAELRRSGVTLPENELQTETFVVDEGKQEQIEEVVEQRVQPEELEVKEEPEWVNEMETKKEELPTFEPPRVPEQRVEQRIQPEPVPVKQTEPVQAPGMYTQEQLNLMVQQAVQATLTTVQATQQANQQPVQPIREETKTDIPDGVESLSGQTTVLVDDVYTDKERQELQDKIGTFVGSSDTTVLIDAGEEDEGHPHLYRLKTGEEYMLRIGDNIIGRQRGIVDIFIDNNPMVSSRHANIKYTIGSNDDIEIIDTSKNGTWVNGVKVASNMPRLLRVGDRIAIADEEFDLVFK